MDKLTIGWSIRDRDGKPSLAKMCMAWGYFVMAPSLLALSTLGYLDLGLATKFLAVVLGAPALVYSLKAVNGRNDNGNGNSQEYRAKRKEDV